MDKKLYIGQNEVKQSEAVLKTNRVKYTLDNNESAEVTLEQMESMALPEPYDPGLVRIKQWKPAVKKILEILLDSNMTLLDKDFVLTRIDENLTQSYEKAVAKVFKKDYVLQITLPDLDNVLKQDEN